jgi:hypothetical protein
MAWSDVLKAVIPITVAALAWLLGQVSFANDRLIKIESAMPALITKEGIPTDSPLSAERRAVMKEELKREIGDLHVRVMLLEQLNKRDLSRRE